MAWCSTAPPALSPRAVPPKTRASSGRSMKGLGWFKATGHIFATAGLKPAGRNRCTFSFIGIDVDEADMDAGKGLPALRINHGVGNEALALGQGAAVVPGKGAGDPNVADRVVVGVTQGESEQRFRAEPGPPPRLRGDLQVI